MEATGTQTLLSRLRPGMTTLIPLGKIRKIRKRVVCSVLAGDLLARFDGRASAGAGQDVANLKVLFYSILE